MSLLSTLRDRESDAISKKPNILELIIFVPIMIMLLIIAYGFFLNLVPEKSEYLNVEKVAKETYSQYSQRLDAISEKYAKELEAIKKN